MVTILLVADQDRLEKLFDFVGDSPQIRFRVSRSLRQGSQDIAEEAPDILFVQNHLSGLSGEIVARHLIGQVEGTRPRVVLFGETEQRPPDQGHLDACLDIARTDEELTAAIIGIISELPSTPTAVESPSMPTEEPAPATSPVEQPVSASTGADIAPSIPDPPIPATDAVVDSFGRQEPSVSSPPKSPFDEKLTTVVEQTAEPVPLAELEDSVSLSTAATAEAPPAPRRPRIGRKETNRRTKLIWTGLAALAAVAVGTTIMLVSPEAPLTEPPLKPAAPAAASAPEEVSSPAAAAPPSPQAAAAPATPPTAPEPRPEPTPKAAPPQQPAGAVGKGLAQLPSFIPREGRDRNYGKLHPGWERYRGARTEFKVYREGAVIRAIQAIDRSGIGIPESFLRGALNQMSSSREFTLETTETQGKFRVEKGTVHGGARLVVYRTVPKGAIRAFVVHFN